MTTIDVERITEHHADWGLNFEDATGGGWMFDCTEDGQILKAPRSSVAYALAGYFGGTYTMRVLDLSCDRWYLKATCPCGEELIAHPGEEFCCDECEREFNRSGQELRQDWRRNYSNYDDEISDLEGYEMAYAGEW